MDLAIWVQIVSTQWLQSRGIQPGFLGGILTQTAWNHNMGLTTFQVQTTPCFQLLSNLNWSPLNPKTPGMRRPISIRLTHLQTLEGRRESQQTKGWKSCAKPAVNHGFRAVGLTNRLNYVRVTSQYRVLKMKRRTILFEVSMLILKVISHATWKVHVGSRHLPEVRY